ncbi:acyl-CoA desaturase [Terracoccus sp. 273MFTsu3.1]|uniref:acyl-CoA desaturase n=1 Tax=Terracoccus sp. 273MFTsu3.1 TaxID=1172188 RepID=UPI001E3340EE|nr:acyl-CoA desaturase [Terracoccus sp. 273MFTsu3.1]
MIHTGQRQALWERLVLGVFIAVPFLALLCALPIAWVVGWVTWLDIALAAGMYGVCMHGVTIGYHRCFTHGAFKPIRPLKIALAIAGSLAIEGAVNTWVGDHRKHHKFSDRAGDPHSPWRYGNNVRALAKGLVYAHVGWLFEAEQSDKSAYIPDLIRDKDMVRISKAFPALLTISLLLPPLVGALVTRSWIGAATAFLWGTLVRLGLVHHVSWSINSICHAIGERPFASRDRAGNVAWLAVLSMGESWHNLHHADPTCARHGVLPGQLDSSARIIRWFEQLGWASDVRWPKPARLAAKRAP